MPFTLSHPAAVLPLRRYCRTRADVVALIIGSTTPDLGYYIGEFGWATFAHTIAGTFAICLPAGIFLLAMLGLLRRPLQLILPWPHCEAFNPTRRSAWRFSIGHIATLLCCLLTGAWTHILWDAFTHESGWFVRQMPWLREPAFLSLPWYSVLQQISTLAGAMVVVLAYQRWVKRQLPVAAPQPRTDGWRYALWAALFASSALFAGVAGLLSARSFHGYLAIRLFLFRSAIYFVDALVLLIILASTLAYAFHRRVA